MMQLLDFEDHERIGPVCWCGGCAEDPCTIREHEAKAYTFGAAVAFGLIGMAEAIRARGWTCPECFGGNFSDEDECYCCKRLRDASDSPGGDPSGSGT